VRPVLLLDMGVVVFLVRPATGELNLAGLAVAEEVVVDEFGAVIGVEAAQREGQRVSDFVHGGADCDLALAHDGAGFAPPGVDVGEVEGLDEVAVGTVAGMGDQVDLGEARGSDIPVLGLDGDMVLEQGTGLRAPVEAAAQPMFGLPEVAIDRAGADGLEVVFHPCRDVKMLPRPGQPEGEEGLEPDRPGVAGGLPDVLQDGQEPGVIGRWAAAAPRCGWTGRLGQGADRGLAVVACGGTDLCEDLDLGDAGRPLVPLPDRLDILAFGRGTHRGLLHQHLGTSSGNRYSDATMGSPVTVQVTRFARLTAKYHIMYAISVQYVNLYNSPPKDRR